MAAVRHNILVDETARKNYVQGVKLLKQERLGPATADLGIPGPPVQVSTYDLFVAWHHLAMDTFTPPPRATATPPTAARCSCPGTASCSSCWSCSSSGC